jgi:tetratricopeptide (TPR) repeat protein
MEKRAVAGVAHSNDTKHRIVRFPGQPLPEVAFEQPSPGLPGLLWVNRPESVPGAQIPDVAQLEAYYTAARKDPSLWPLWFRKLDELSKKQPDDPTVLNSLGAVALAEKKDNASAEEYFAHALKEGSEEPTTFMNLATALANLGRGPEAERVLERGVADYPYSGPLTARLAQQYATDGERAKALKLVEHYGAFFPEDPMLREVKEHLGAAGMSTR